MTNPPRPALLAIIGGGNMAQAIIRGAFDARLLAPFEVVVVEPDAAKRTHFEHWGVRTFAPTALAEALAGLAIAPPADPRRAGQLMLAVKPQSLDEVAVHLRPLLTDRRMTIITMLAGTTTRTIHEKLGDHLDIIRVMPNTPASVRKGVTALTLAQGTPPERAELARDLFSALGELVTLDESRIDAFAAVAGSGPAYVFYLAEAMIKAAQDLGLDRITADRIVRQTLVGAAALLSESTQPPEMLRAQVTSKGGMTAAATAVLDERAVQEALIAAITAARDRGAEMART